MIKKNQPGAEILSKNYESPSLTAQTVATETGFAQSNGISDMPKWNQWESVSDEE